MYEVRRDVAKNRVYIKLVGRMDVDEANEAAAAVRAELARCSPGFTLLSDVSEFQPVTQDAAAVIGAAKQDIEAAGVAAVARVTGGSSIGNMQMERAGGVEYPAHQVGTFEEAERVLDGV